MTQTPLLVPFDLDAALGATGPGALARVAGRFARYFTVVSPFAPGLSCIGAEVVLDADAAAIEGAPRISATGTGTTIQRAVMGCLGEAADLLSQYERPGDIAARGVAGTLAAAVRDGWLATVLGDGIEVDWVAATAAGSGAVSLLPADLCLRRAPARRGIAPVGPLSAGVAAGPTRDMAATRAVLELCERDALALWWLGGSSARRFPDDHPATLSGRSMIERLRQGERDRATQLLDLSGDLAVPVVAAVSLDGTGRGLACGAAARLDPAEAAEAAVLELCQMELAAPLARAKLAQRGAAALGEADRRHLRRDAWPSDGCMLLRPDRLSEMPASDRSEDPLADLLRRLADHGIAVHLVDVTRSDVGVPVMRAMAPRLQPFAQDVVTQRLETARSGTNAVSACAAVPLF